MSHDPALRVLLGLILACLVLLVAQGFGLGAGAGQGPYRISVIKSKTPWLMRVNTDTGLVEQFEIKGDRRWVTLGERELELGEMEGGEEDIEAPFAETEPAPRRPKAAPHEAPQADAPQGELDALVDAVKPGNPREIRSWAANLLGSYVAEAPDKAVPALVGALGDPDGEVVVAAAHSLSGSRSPAALAALRKLEGHPDAQVQAAARKALAGPD